jgi:Fe-S-cluster containining protein
METTKHKCQKCRECCKFENDEVYFAPLFTKAEVERINNNFSHKAVFNPYKDSANVFQVGLVKSTENSELWVCPFLDEKTHLCSIYSERNLDCRMWPFIFMHGKSNEVLLAHFDRDMCPIWNDMNEEDFLKVKKRMICMLEEEKVLQTIREHPELAWEHEQYTNIMSRHKIDESSQPAMQTF